MNPLRFYKFTDFNKGINNFIESKKNALVTTRSIKSLKQANNLDLSEFVLTNERIK